MPPTPDGPRFNSLQEQLAAWYAQRLKGQEPPPNEGPYLLPWPIVLPPPN